MKRRLLLLIILFGYQTIFAQDKISESEKLISTAKVWGFLKYYHPNVADGTYNWDQQLFDVLPKIEEAETKQDFSEVLTNWINSLGQITECISCTSESLPNHFEKNFDLSWTQDQSVFTPELSALLESVERNRYQGKPFYIAPSGAGGNIDVSNEPNYPEFNWKQKKLRLLALFRYWNIIEYFFPYKYQTDQPWDEVLQEMLPKFLEPETEQDYHLAMLEMVVKTNDGRSRLFTKYTSEFFGRKWLPVKFDIIDQKAVVTGYYNYDLAAENNLQTGDIILEFEGKTISEILEERLKYLNGSNMAVKLKNTYFTLFNGNSEVVKLKIERNKKIQEITAARYEYSQFNYRAPKQEKWKLVDENIAYVNLGAIENNEIPNIMAQLSDTEAIIFDFRNQPNGLMRTIARYVSDQKVEFYKKIVPDLQYPGKYLWQEGSTCGDGQLRYMGRIVLLVNEETLGNAEFTCMCLQTNPNITIIGSQTAGVTGNATDLELVGGFKTAISGMGIFYPDKTEIQRVGIQPHIVVKPSIESIVAGKDEAFEEAINLLTDYDESAKLTTVTN